MDGTDRFFTALGDALFPNRCGGCGRFFHPPRTEPHPSKSPGPEITAALFENLMAGVLCPDCRCLFFPVASPKCPICGEMFKSPLGGDHTCSRCLQNTRHFSCIRSAGQYEGALMRLIHQFKYNAKKRLARPLGGLLFHAFAQFPELNATGLVVPVPLHRARARKRGFNQSALLLARWPAWFRRYEIKGVAIAADDHILKRVKKTPAQIGLNRNERQSNLRGAFAAGPAKQIRGRRILLVDDVATTGATVDECARTLKRAGAAAVNVLTLARAA